MDPLSLGFLALVVILGGFVAWIADGLGRKLGKSRRTLMGLRPRHTATLLTVGAGALIPLLTVMIVMGASADVRRWFFEGRQAIRDAERYKLDLAQETRNLHAAQALTVERTRFNEKLLGQISRLGGETKRLESERRKAEGLRAKAREEYAAAAKQASARLRGLQVRLQGEQIRFRTISARVASLDRRIASGQRQLAIVNTALRSTTKELKTANSQLKISLGDRSEAIKDRDRIAAENEKLLTEANRLQGQISDLKSQREDSQRATEKAQRDLEEVQLSLDAARADYTRTAQQLEGLDRISRYNPILFWVNEEIARTSVPAGLSPEAARQTLDSVLGRTRGIAKERGANAPPGKPVADFLYRPDQGGQLITPQQQAQIVVQGITNLADPVVLIVSAVRNSFFDEPVGLDVKAYRNPVVYHANEMLAEVRLDGRAAESVLVRQFNEFISGRVVTRARADGMIPIRAREESFGTEIGSEQLLDLVRRVKAEGRIVRVQALTQGETRAADPLRLTFRIR